MLRQFVKSGTPFILLSSHRDQRRSNVDAPTGDLRYVDVTIAPFNLPPPLRWPDDPCDGNLGLWSREQVTQALTARYSAG